MCGIFGYFGHQKQAQRIVLEGLKTLEYRGYDSWGVATVDHDKIVVKKQVGKIGDGNVDDLPNATIAFGHTRWATHGGVTQTNSHPHLDCEGKIAVIHNGIFENYEEVKKDLVEKGHRFISETDTEVIVHMVEENMKKDVSFVQAVRKSFLQMRGQNAFIAMNKDEELVAVRQGSPLVIGFGKSENFLASDPSALLPHTKDVYYLEDGEMAEVKQESVVVTEIESGRVIKLKIQKLEWDSTQTQLGKYSHYMLKEIYEQPKTIRQIGESSSKYHLEIAKKLKAADRIYLVGCGSSAYEALIGKYLFSSIAKLQTVVEIGSEFRYDLDFVTEKTVVIALSQSGETMDLLEPLKMAKAKGATIIAIVNVLGSSLYRLADEKLLIGVGPEKAVATTKALTGKVAELILLSYALGGNFDEGKKQIVRASRAVEQVLTPKSILKIKKLAKHLAKHEHVYVIGRGISCPLALESALKIKEVSYIHAEGLSGGELKHGTLALITQGTPFIAYLPSDETYQATLSGAMEMKARGGYLIGVSSKPNPIFDEYIEIEDVGMATILPNVVFAQLLSYYLALELKLDPDIPRNLAKSVTVK